MYRCISIMKLNINQYLSRIDDRCRYYDEAVNNQAEKVTVDRHRSVAPLVVLSQKDVIPIL